MKTLHRYLTREVIGSLVLAVLVFTFVLMIGNILKEVLGLLVNHHASLFSILLAVGLLIPYVLVYAVPMGLLTATLLVFGRFSADNELTAARAGGISLVALASPILILSLGFSVACAGINLYLAPFCRAQYKDLLYRAGVENAAALVDEDRFEDRIPGYIIYVEKLNGTKLHNVILYKLDGKEIVMRAKAASGSIVVDRTNQTADLQLFQAFVEFKDSAKPPSAETNLLEIQAVPASATDSNALSPNEPAVKSSWHWIRMDYDLPQIDLKKMAGRALKLNEMTISQLLAKVQECKTLGVEATPVLVLLHQQIAFSFASFGFALIGIPLGVRAHRRETSIGVAIAIGLVLAYYSFFVLAQALVTRPEYRPQLILWAPNFLFQGAGAFLLWRANRRG